MLFTGYADLESIIAAINQGHIFQFLKKPWQPEELEAAVRQAAAEYDRLSGADATATNSARDRQPPGTCRPARAGDEEAGGMSPPARMRFSWSVSPSPR